MTKYRLLVLLFGCLFMNAANSQTKTINVNLYGTAIYNDAQWNNWQTTSSLTSPVLRYSDGSLSTITAVLSAQNGYSDNGGAYPVTMCPQQVGRDASWANAARTLVFSGLDNNKTYNFQLYASRGNAGQTTRFTINTTVVDIATYLNYTNIASFTNISPSGGVITISMAPLGYYTYLNGFSMVEQTSSNLPPTANAGPNQNITLPVSTVNLSGSGNDPDGTIVSYAWSQVSGTAATITTPNAQNTSITGLTTAGVRVFRLTVTDNQGATGTSDVTITVNPANQSPTANAGPNQNITLPVSTVNLSGSGNDPDGTIASYAWSQVSGTAATITTPNAQNTSITGLTTAGVRVFRLTVTDNQGATGTSDVTITVNPANQSPTANAGPNQTITLPVSTVNLSGSGNDPDGTIASYAWSQVSGTAATITTPNAQNTSITGLTTAGVRVFRLTVTDNQGATGTSDVTITVNPANQSPTANAGPNQTITLPVSTVNLTGSGNDPDGTIASYAWSQVSGTAATINTPNAQNTSINGLTTAGVRVFRLTVTDNLGATGTSDVTITVNNGFDVTPPTVTTNSPQTITDSTASFTSIANSNFPVSSTRWTKFSVPGQTLKRITVVGSSTSEGTGASVPDSSFVNKLKKYYKDQGLIDTIYNLSVGGTSPFDLNITQALNKGAEILLVNYPSNNYTAGNRAATIARFQEIKDSCDARGVQFYCTGTQPRDNYDAAGRLNLVILNDSLRNRFGERFIDFLKPTLNTADNTLIPDYSYGDQTHVNNKGHELFFQLVKAKNLFSNIITSASIIVSPSFSSTQVTKLIPGVHQFQVSILDSRGMAASAVARVTTSYNFPPTANAGTDQVIILPVNEVTVNGTGNDPDGTVASYQWTKLTGPATFTIVSPAQAQTVINNLVQGVYTFELQVTDNLGATGLDTVMISVNSGPNQSPTANAGADQSITLPVNTVTLTGAGNDPDGIITGYQWTKLTGPATFTIVSPAQAQTVINNLVQGVYTFELQVTDNQGATGLDTVQVTVNPAPNQPPTANAGADQSVTLPVNTVTLTGAGNDPDGTISGYLWTKLTGPATFTIVSPAQAQTVINNLIEGVYTFELQVTDNQGAPGLDTVQVTVNPAPNQPPTANAGANQTINPPATTASLTGSGTDPDGTITSYGWTQVSGTAATITSPSSASTTITGLTTAGARVFRLTVTDNNGATGTSDVTITVNQAPTANAGANQTINPPATTASLTGSGTDADGTIASYAWTQVSGTAATITSPLSASTTITGLTTAGARVFRLTVTDNNGATGTSDVTITVNQAPTANAGTNQTINPPATTASLTGSGTDADGTIASYAWTQVSGTAATITSPSSASTTITGLTTAGARVFRLTVTDNNGATGTSDVTITVNQAPTANAGANQTINPPATTASLTGSGTDADGTIVSYAWSQVSGTAATITSPSSASTTITGLTTAGARVFRLTVTDNNGATGISNVTITVNQAPTANAGTNQTINPPATTASLTGSGTDADGTIVSYAWSQVSGTAATITTPNAQNTTITGLTTTGTRVFRLTVTDNNGATGTSDVTITVSPANQVPTANAGTNQIFSLPITSTTLTGSGTDPDGTIVSYAWTQVSGTAATITSPSSANTTITNLTTTGVRVFRLTVTDNGGATATSDVSVTVNSASVLDPTDIVYNYNSNSPPTEPPYGQIGKWVRTQRLNWNSTSLKCYYYKGRAFRLKFPKTYDPAVNDGKKYPMLIFFHGRGEAGTIYDNEYSLLHGGQGFRDAVDNDKFDGYIIVMQTQGGSWGPSEYAYMKEIIDYMITYNKLDPFKVITNGLSAGAQGTWEMYNTYPTYIASLLPMSGVYSSFAQPSYVNNVKYTPIWNFHGGLDGSPAPYTAFQVRDAMEAAGANYTNTLYPDLGHGTWNTAWAEPNFWPYVNSAYMANPWPLFGRTEFCPGDPINVTIGLIGGMSEYQWRKDGVVIPGATSNSITATSIGTYDARIRRGTIWSDWSRKPVQIVYKAATVSPDIQITGLASKVIPAPDGKTTVSLEVPAGYTSYLWQKVGSNTTISTTRNLVASTPGEYIVKVTEQYGCSSNFSSPFKVIDANGPNKPDPAINLSVISEALDYQVLNWSDNPSPVYNETNFEIYRAEYPEGPYTFIGMTNADVLTFTATNLISNRNYFYKVRAVNNTGAAVVSNIASGKTLADTIKPTSPGNLSIVSSNRSSITLHWDASTDNIGVTKYHVYVNGLFSYVTNETTFIVSSLTYGQTYNFRVQATDFAGNLSPFSNQVTGQPVLAGLPYKYYTFNGTWNNLPDFTTLVPDVVGIMPNVDISQRTQNDNFAFLWEGYIQITQSGTYYFRTNSDDGSKLWLGALNGTGSPYSYSGTPLVDNDGLHGTQNATSNAITLTAGVYPIAIAFYEQGGGEAMTVSWRTPSTGTSYVTIPNSAFAETVTPGGTAPLAPNDITATAVSYNLINLTWIDNSSNETGFEIYRSTNNTTGFVTVGLAPANATSFNDSTVSPSTTYYYKMRAVGQFGESVFAPVNSLEANWKFNNNYTDDSGNGKVISGSNGPTFSTDRQEGSHSIDLDGSNDYINVNSSSGDYLRGGYDAKTVAFWMKSDVSNSNRGIFDFGGSDDGLAMRINGNQLYAGIASNNTRRSISTPYSSTGWNHVALVYNADVLRLYLNGTEVASNTSLGFTSVGSTSNGSRIGDDNSSNALNTSFGVWDGHFDDFYVIGSALSPAQVARVMNGTIQFEATATTPGLPAVPVVPSNLLASGVSSSKINISWNDNATTETKYELFRSDNTPDNYLLLSALPPNSTSYIDSGLFANSVYYYKVRAVNQGGNSAFSNADSAKSLNSIPVIVDLPNQAARYGQTKSISITASDSDGDPLSFSILNMPVFGTFTDNGNKTATLQVNPAANQQGVYSDIRVIVSDTHGGADTTIFVLTVNDNYDPTIASIPNISLNEGDTTTINLVASDLNPGDILSWQVTGAPNNHSLTPVSNGFTKLFLNPGYADAGVYTVQAGVTDGNGGSATRSFTITVINREPPTTTLYLRFRNQLTVGTPWNNINGLVTNNLRDDKNNITSVGLSMQGSWYATYVDGPNTGNNSGVFKDSVLREYYFFGQYPGVFTAPSTITSRITGLNLSSKYTISFHAGSIWAVQANNGTTNFTIGAQTIPLNVQNNTQNLATFSGITPAPDGSITFTMATAPGTSVGYLNAIKIVSQYDDNTAPAAPTQLIAVNHVKGVQLGWTDVAYNEDAYQVYRSLTSNGTYTLVGQASANAVNFIDSTVSGNLQYYYKVRAINGVGPSAYSNIATVFTENRPPVIAAINSVTLRNDQQLAINITATDDPSNQITLSAEGLPSFATLIDYGNGTGVINIVPTTGIVGFYPGIIIRAKDNYNASTTTSFNITVTDKSFVTSYINFTDGGATLAPFPWNNFVNPPVAGASLTNIRNDNNAVTGMTVTLNNGFQWFVVAGMQPGNNTNIYPTSVMRTAFYEGSTTTRTITVSGLSTANKYNFVFFNSHEDGFKGRTNFTINGQTVSLDATYNANKTAQINGIAPNASGQVVITVAKASGQDYAYLTSMIIQSYAATSTTLFEPADLRVTDIKRNAVSLQWQDRASDETGYEVWRATSINGTYSLVTTLGANVTTYTNTGLSQNTVYYYKVRAARGTTRSDYSNIVQVRTYAFVVYVNYANTLLGPSPWNNTQAVPQQGYVWTNLRDETNIPTNTGMEITKNFDGLYSAGVQTGNNSGIYPDNVMFDSYGLFPGNSAEFKFSGLNISMKYDLTFFASSVTWGDLYTAYTVNGKTVLLDASVNTTGTVTMYNVSPDVNGEIIIGVAPGTPTSQFGLLGALQLQGYTPPPATAASGPQQMGKGDIIDDSTAVEQPLITENNKVETDKSTTERREETRVVTDENKVTAYPNPFVREITLAIDLVKQEDVRVTLFNQSGQVVYTNQFKSLSAGTNYIKLIPGNTTAAKGIYFIRVEFSDSRKTQIIKLLKQ